jgi:hypothetical protein
VIVTAQSSTPLPAIIALARAGSLDRAWACFTAAGYDRVDEIAALTLKGRLLKGLALGAPEQARPSLYGEAATAYERAAAKALSSYALINAATLSLLSGAEGEAKRLAQETLDLLRRNPDESETPYYRDATRAEALLLLGRVDAARAALAQAVAVAPRAWEDHAVTLTQFALILRARQCDGAWLDAFRPPRSLHFGGHMSFGADTGRAPLKSRIADLLRSENIGFGYGALAAGADIIVAEALLEHGAELHAVLPGGRAHFADLSVEPYGPDWRRRFDAVLERAASVREIRPCVIPDRMLIGIADEVAMGSALINARRLETSAVQLLVLAQGASERARDVWAEAGRRQHILHAPREDLPGDVPVAPAYQWLRLALLYLSPEEGDAAFARIKEALAALAAPALHPYLEGGAVVLAYPTPGEAARVAVTLRQRLGGLRIGGHYGVAQTLLDPFTGRLRARGDAAAVTAGALSSALPGEIYLTEDFAAALIACAPEMPRVELIGELEPPEGGAPVGLYVLKS